MHTTLLLALACTDPKPHDTAPTDHAFQATAEVDPQVSLALHVDWTTDAPGPSQVLFGEGGTWPLRTC